MGAIGFDNDKYVKLQSQNIRDRISKFGGKLYLEFGGKLFDDYHASRVLPGFHPDSKVRMLLEMKDEAEIVIAISADDIERNKHRGDLGITYDEDTPAPHRRLPRHRAVFRQRRHHALPRSGRGGAVPEAAGIAGHPRVQALHNPRLPSNVSLIVVRRGLRQERLHRDGAQPCRCHRARPRQRQNGHLPQPALS